MRFMDSDITSIPQQASTIFQVHFVKDLTVSSPYRLSYISLFVSFENLVLYQDSTPKLITFLVLITSLLENVCTL